MLTIGVVVLGITDRPRATEFWRQALGYVLHDDGFGGWATVLEPYVDSTYPSACRQNPVARGPSVMPSTTTPIVGTL